MKVVSREEWLQARRAHLAAEKQLTRMRDTLAAERRALPRVRIEADYRFDTEAGEVALEDLFGDARQLVVQHFMFGPDWQAGCKSCSFWADGFDRIVEHLAARDARFVAVSRAPLAKLLAYRARMGWSFPWVSSLGSSFNFDFGVSFTDEAKASGEAEYNYVRGPIVSSELPGVSTFERTAEGVFHAYSTYGRGLDRLNPAYQLLDLLPHGRNEQDLDYSMAWLRRRDEY